MLVPLTAGNAETLRGFFLETGFSEPGLTEALGGRPLPMQAPVGLYRLEYAVRKATPFALLVRWFYFYHRVERSVAASKLPREVLELLLNCGLLKAEAGFLVSMAAVLPFRGMWIASDYYPRDGMEFGADKVIGVNLSAVHLLHLTLRRPWSASLDLGTGCGIQALFAAAHSHSVTATDLNPRACDLAAFNASLNGVANMECLQGDRFQPVSSRSFDLIVSNPPFFMTLSRNILFSDNDMDLDGFCHSLVREAPRHLTEGGWFLMNCEWVQMRGEPWRERLEKWLDGAGCDAWIIKANTQLPESYAETRLRESPLPGSVHAYAELVDHFRSLAVVAIHGGFLSMRRRTGDNWVKFDELRAPIVRPLGEALWQGFAAQDFLHSHDMDERLFQARPRLSSQVRLSRESTPGADGWKNASTYLSLGDDLGQTLGLDQVSADLVAKFDGSRTVSDIVQRAAALLSLEPSQAQPRVLHLVRMLIEQRMLLPE